uniref:hypothetical protein n=1 Tax=Hugenholtzia roseola TaxID=1002 RepID=UPI0004794260
EDDDYDDEDDYEQSQSGIYQPKRVNPSNKQFLTFNIENQDTLATSQTVTLFGSFSGNVNDRNVHITLDESDYKAFLAETVANPYVLGNPRYRVQDAAQYSNTFSVKEIDAVGAERARKVQPANFEDPRNQNDRLIIMDGFSLVADGKSTLSFNLPSLQKVTLTFEVLARVNNSKMLRGNSAIDSLGSLWGQGQQQQARKKRKSSDCGCGGAKRRPRCR